MKITIFNQTINLLKKNDRNFYLLLTSELKKLDLKLELGC